MKKAYLITILLEKENESYVPELVKLLTEITKRPVKFSIEKTGNGSHAHLLIEGNGRICFSKADAEAAERFITKEKEPIKNLVRLLNTNFDNTDEKLKITFDKPVKDRQKLID